MKSLTRATTDSKWTVGVIAGCTVVAAFLLLLLPVRNPAVLAALGVLLVIVAAWMVLRNLTMKKQQQWRESVMELWSSLDENSDSLPRESFSSDDRTSDNDSDEESSLDDNEGKTSNTSLSDGVRVISMPMMDYDGERYTRVFPYSEQRTNISKAVRFVDTLNDDETLNMGNEYYVSFEGLQDGAVELYSTNDTNRTEAQVDMAKSRITAMVYDTIPDKEGEGAPKVSFDDDSFTMFLVTYPEIDRYVESIAKEMSDDSTPWGYELFVGKRAVFYNAKNRKEVSHKEENIMLLDYQREHETGEVSNFEDTTVPNGSTSTVEAQSAEVSENEVIDYLSKVVKASAIALKVERPTIEVFSVEGDNEGYIVHFFFTVRTITDLSDITSFTKKVDKLLNAKLGESWSTHMVGREDEFFQYEATQNRS